MRRHQGGFRERVVRLPSFMAGAHETTDGASLQGEAREAYVEAMFDRISAPYDRLNRIIAVSSGERIPGEVVVHVFEVR